MLINHDIAQSGSAGGSAPRSRHRELDQFYTRPEVAKACMQHVMRVTAGHAGLWLEPSAGTGSFLDLLPVPRLGLDLDDQIVHPEIQGGQDFLQWHSWRDLPQPIVTVGNPPFGRNASLALKFLNHAMLFSRHVCMILPRTFEKAAMKAKVSTMFDIEHEETLEAFSFVHDGKPYDVPCCFQIWSRVPNDGRRTKTDRYLVHSDFKFVDNHENAHFAFQRVGGKAGHVSTEGLRKSWKSHYFIHVLDPDKVDTVRSILSGIDWKQLRERTAGNPSIGKGELVDEYTKIAGPSVPDQGALAF